MRRRRLSSLTLLALAGATALSVAPAGAQSTAPAGVPTGAGNLPDLGGTPQTSDQPSAQGTPDQGNASIQSSLGPTATPAGCALPCLSAA